jgi:hypothetical protein
VKGKPLFGTSAAPSASVDPDCEPDNLEEFTGNSVQTTPVNSALTSEQSVSVGEASRLLRSRREHRAADQRDELTPFQLTELHPTIHRQGIRDTITDCPRSSQELAAVRNFHPANVGLGVKTWSG